MRKRLRDLERWTKLPNGPEGSEPRKRMIEHLDRMAALKRGELGPEEAAEVEALSAAIEARLREIRGEGRR